MEPRVQNDKRHNENITIGGSARVNFGDTYHHYGNVDGRLSLNNVLRSLPTAKAAPFNSYQRQHEPTCLSGTRADLLQDIYDWADSERSPAIFWLSGLAGTGKSTIAQTVAKGYHQKGRLAASFFFSRASGEVNHAGNFVTTIAVQLADSIPELKSKICDAIIRRSDIASRSLDDQWQDLIIRPMTSIQDKENLSKYVLVVDALDECDDHNNVQIILQCLAGVQSLPGLKLRVLLTSRPEARIQYDFTQVRRAEYQDFVLHDIEPATVEQDISDFLRHRLGLIGQKFKLNPGWVDERAIAVLVANSGGLFIWAATACRFIEEDIRLAETRLSSLLRQECSSTLPPERKLDEIYTTVLANFARGEYEAGEVQKMYLLFRQVVGPIVILQDPLSVASLAELLEKDVATLRKTLNNLHSVLSVPEDDWKLIRPLHASFRDFLLDPTRCSDREYSINEGLIHRTIYERCLQIMSTHLRRDICNLQRPATSVDDLISEEVSRHIQPDVQYACRFWVYHFRRSDLETKRYDDVEFFLHQHLLQWLEALALLGRISDAVNMIRVLDSLDTLHSVIDPSARVTKDDRIEYYTGRVRFRDKLRFNFQPVRKRETKNTFPTPSRPACSNLRDLIHDATRFVLTFRPILEEAPLQVYYAALVFSPNKSIVRQTFLNEAPAWLQRMPNVSETWSPCLQTLEGHSESVTAVAFSPDCKTLASASLDRTVKLWEAASGKALRTLKGHSHEVTAVVFSPDGKTLASASEDRTVKLWEAGSGKVLWTLEGHSERVTAVAFSPDGKMLASASVDRTVKLWEAGSGKAARTLEGHSERVTAVAFSPDGKTLASASLDWTVKLWEAGSGKALQTLEGHSHSVTAVAFLRNAKMLASASVDRTVKLWEAGSGKALQTLEGHSLCVTAVAFSPDGKTLASASEDRTVKLWEAGSGKVARTLEGHSERVTAVAFSPDGKTLASASDDLTLKLWEAGSGKAQTLKGHSHRVTAVAFSPDGKTLASASHDRTVKLWEAGSGKALQTLKGHSHWVTAVAFSPDGKTLVSASFDRTVKLWEAGSGKALQTLEAHSHWLTDVAFSPDGKMLASASLDRTVKLWEAGSGKALRTIEDHSYSLPQLLSNNIDVPQPASMPWILVEEKWISWRGERVLWLPSEYRSAVVASQGSCVGLGCSSGLLLILNFSHCSGDEPHRVWPNVRPAHTLV
ncbi:hypothetical protein M433DRAFT_159236 [Acidomyces richmondensis BFW]|nr:hypothetical protein M433DRAFT_159236 [Acidomyces richmondensis BFW]